MTRLEASVAKILSPLQINSGRVMIRQVGANANMESPILAFGFLHLPAAFVPKENACYLLMYESENVYVLPDCVDEGYPHVINDAKASMPISISDAMQAPIWPTPIIQNMMPVRFLKAFPESNEWVCYGISKSNVFSDVKFDAAGHVWLDVTEGVANPIPSPTSEVGKTPDQILREPIWPNASGDLYSLSAIESTWRPIYFALSQIYASFGGGEITEHEMRAQIKANPLFDHIKSSSMNKEYCHYLFEMRKLNGLQEDGPKSIHDYYLHKELIKKCIRIERPAPKAKM